MIPAMYKVVPFTIVALAVAALCAGSASAGDESSKCGKRYERVEPLGRTGKVFHAVKGEKRWLLFQQKRKKCRVYPIGRALARATGPFGKDGAKRKAFVVAKCAEEQFEDIHLDPATVCRQALAVRKLDGTMLDAVELTSGPEADITTVRWFGKQAGIVVETRDESIFDSGNAWGTLQGYRLLDDRLERVFTSGGSTSIEAAKRESCPTISLARYPYKLRVTKRGKVPAFEVVRVPSMVELGDTFDGEPFKPDAVRSVFTWSKRKKKFVEGKRTPAELSATDACWQR